ncbi:glycoside hydrolase family 27 protein [Cylindrobasidium torrendii FP15055 ss-10]|uniref:Alpha-galactosidase n=1 Tax=Cylindrobasidium torrendii FP15055 ss-10 TaxID=1314674 RepID=A0A0D7B9F0_9AGAR|nr:glycoside hydrolase family 27 protein [Cylindrobasidium torrendii FP15055 ss-10]
MFYPAVAARQFLASVDGYPPLHSLSIATTANGFDSPARGWNSFGIQSNPNTTPNWTYDQEHVLAQCDALEGPLADLGYTYCSLDSGWSVGLSGDEHGRIIYDADKFNITEMADHLHERGLNIGVYVVPGAFQGDANKTIAGTDITIGEACYGDNGLGRCNWNYTVEGAQQWHDSVVQQFAEWGVDFIKLDYVTPGSPENNVNLPADTSNDVVAYHRAIEKSGRPMRLDISWKLERNSEFFPIWSSSADTFRTDQDINNGGEGSFLKWSTVQRAINNYRQYMSEHSRQDEVLTIYPDLDNLYVGNTPEINGVSEDERFSIMSHWMAAGSNLMIGNDLTNLDDTGRSILTNADALAVADFAATYPIRPRNPGTGLRRAKQLQAWIGGPSPTGETVILLANYGPDQGSSGFQSSLSGPQNVLVTWADLGITGSFKAKDVWKGLDLGEVNDGFNATLREGESLLVRMMPTGSGSEYETRTVHGRRRHHHNRGGH